MSSPLKGRFFTTGPGKSHEGFLRVGTYLFSKKKIIVASDVNTTYTWIYILGILYNLIFLSIILSLAKFPRNKAISEILVQVTYSKRALRRRRIKGKGKEFIKGGSQMESSFSLISRKALEQVLCQNWFLLEAREPAGINCESSSISIPSSYGTWPVKTSLRGASKVSTTSALFTFNCLKVLLEYSCFTMLH